MQSERREAGIAALRVRGSGSPRFSRVALALAAGLMLLVFTARDALAQLSSTHGSLAVRVADSSGAVLPGAEISVRHLDQGWVRKSPADQAGSAVFASLPPGRYELSASAPGFAAQTMPVELLLGHQSSLRLTLAPATVRETVTVTAPVADAIDAATPSVHSHIAGERIEGLPINQRNFLDFSLLDSGVQRDTLRVHAVANTSGFNVMGQRPRSNLLQLDGSDANDEVTGGVRNSVPMDAVQEFLVLPGGYQAEHGRASGGVVNVITKSGGNQFHASVFGFLRHRSLDATNAFAAVKDPPYTRTQYGVSTSGPLRRERTFFFAAVEQLRRQETGFSQVARRAQALELTAAQKALKQADPTNAAVTAAERGLAIARTGIDPGTGREPSYGVAPLLALAELYPESQALIASSVRLDHSLSERHRAAVRLNYASDRVSAFEPQNNDQIAGLLAFGRTGASRTIDPTVVMSLNSTFGAHLVNEVRLSWARRQFEMLPNSEQTPVNIPGAAFLGREPILPHRRSEQHGHFQEIVTVSRGSHLLKAGGDLMYCPMEIDYQRETNGLFTFGPQPAPGAPADSPALTAVQAYGLGLAANYVQQFGNPRATVRKTSAGLFLQDSWRVASRFSVEAGARYDIERVSPAPVAGESAALYRRLGVLRSPPADWNNLQPRIGFSYQLAGGNRLALRGAYGVYYDRLPGLAAYLAQVGDGVQMRRSILTGDRATEVFRLPAQKLAAVPGSAPPPALVAFAKDWKLGYSQHLNLTLAAEVKPNTTVDLAYVAVKGSRLGRTHDFNPADSARSAAFLAGGNSVARLLEENYFRADTEASEVMAFEGSASSIYHGLRGNLRARLGWLSLHASYTFSKAIDDAEEILPHSRAQDMRSIRAEHGLALYDQRHRLVATSVIKPPALRGASFAGTLLKGWSIAPVLELGSGRPVNVLLGFDNNLDQFPGSDRPDVDLMCGDSTTRTVYGCFAVPPPGCPGNLGRNAFMGPGYASLNLRLQRSLELERGASIELMLEGFNILNRVNVRSVNPNFQHAGEPLSAYEPRQLQIGVRARF